MIRWTERAVADLVEIGAYIAPENPSAARSWVERLRHHSVVRVIGYQYARMLERPDLYGPSGSEELVAKGRTFKYMACDRAIEVLGEVMNLMDLRGVDRAWEVEKH